MQVSIIIVGGLVLIAAGTLVDSKYRTDHFLQRLRE